MISEVIYNDYGEEILWLCPNVTEITIGGDSEFYLEVTPSFDYEADTVF